MAEFQRNTSRVFERASDLADELTVLLRSVDESTQALIAQQMIAVLQNELKPSVKQDVSLLLGSDLSFASEPISEVNIRYISQIVESILLKKQSQSRRPLTKFPHIWSVLKENKLHPVLKSTFICSTFSNLDVLSTALWEFQLALDEQGELEIVTEPSVRIRLKSRKSV